MLHMVEITHDPATCATSNQKSTEMAKFMFSNIEAKATELGVKIEGGWLFPQGHKFWYVIDAPDAHLVSKFVAETQIFHWNTVRIHPVATLEESGRQFLASH